MTVLPDAHVEAADCVAAGTGHSLVSALRLGNQLNIAALS